MNKTQFNRSEHKRIKAGLPSKVDQFLMMPSILLIFLPGDKSDNERNILMFSNSPRHCDQVGSSWGLQGGIS